VIADLEHHINAMLAQIKVSPSLDPRPLRQYLRRNVHRIAAMVIQDDELGRAASKQPFASGTHIGLQPGPPRRPVLRQTTPNLTHTPQLRRALHIDAYSDKHAPRLLNPRLGQCSGMTPEAGASLCEGWAERNQLLDFAEGAAVELKLSRAGVLSHVRAVRATHERRGGARLV
jgi:hypothetical protein